MKNLELKNYGVINLDSEEMCSIKGGATAAAFPWLALLTQVSQHWGEIKSGFSQGFNAQI